MHDELWLDIDSFIPKLMKRCGNLGVRMKELFVYHQTNMQELNNVNTVRELLKWLVEECRKIDNGRLQLIVCVMPERHDGYKSPNWCRRLNLHDDRYMFIGADVNHPAASNTESPSVAAIVGSVDLLQRVMSSCVPARAPQRGDC
ncbi:putative ribonuclease H-like superfamily [Helianthus annuus]|nr:putative ribonuclease H-like superfamily [Helianthus annuus]